MKLNLDDYRPTPKLPDVEGKALLTELFVLWRETLRRRTESHEKRYAEMNACLAKLVERLGSDQECHQWLSANNYYTWPDRFERHFELVGGDAT